MTTTREVIETLLEVQGHDTRIDQVRHRLEVLPERAERDRLRGEVEGLDATIAARRSERDDLARQQKRLDDEVQTIGAKRTTHTDHLYDGSVTNARELQDLQDEVESLGRRITELEDQELELMEAAEPVDAALAELDADRTRSAAALEAAEGVLTAAEAELQAELAEEQSVRAERAAGVPAELLAEYDTLRAGGRGVGIARLVGGNQCGGCHLTLSAVEVATIRKHPDQITHCEECGRLLVP